MSDAPALLILSQVYVPDPASVGQHLHDVAVEMTRRGYRVRVLTSDRGYEQPAERFASHEWLDGVEIRRLPWSSFGKGSLSARLAGGGVFLGQALPSAWIGPRPDLVLVSTSPPMCGITATVLGRFAHVPVVYWVMDINPDQVVASGVLPANALAVRGFDWMNRQILRDARRVVTLDPYMAERLTRKAGLAGKLEIIPPWPHVETAEPILEHEDNAFRAGLRLRDRLLLMYSGNLSPVHPIDAVLDAARALRDDTRFGFVFVGGGLDRERIDRYVAEHGLPNVESLPYQPLPRLRESLSAADVHLVAMGANMVGVVHPCKVYGAMAVGRPILVLAPERCHLSDLVRAHDIGFRVDNRDRDGVVATLQLIAGLPRERLRAMGARARGLIDQEFSRDRLLRRFADALDSARSGERPGSERQQAL